jgi:cytochrome c
MRWILLLVACGSSPNNNNSPDLAQAQSAYTWTSNAQSFFATYCVSCHTPGGQAQQQDFSQYDVVVANAATIRCGVASTKQSGCGSVPAPKQFPIGTGPKPTDGERDAIVAWIDAGTPK